MCITVVIRGLLHGIPLESVAYSGDAYNRIFALNVIWSFDLANRKCESSAEKKKRQINS